MDPNTDPKTHETKVEMVSLPKGDFDTLVKNQLDTKTWLDENRDKIITSDALDLEKVAELEKRMKAFDETMREFREENAGVRLYGGGSKFIDRKFDNPMQALLTTIPEKDHPIRNWQVKSDMVYLGLIMEKTPGIKWLDEKLEAKGGFKESIFFKQFQAETKAMYTSGTGVGTEFVPTLLSADLFEEVRLATKVAAMHPSFPMNSKNVEIPGQTGRTYAELIPESTSDSSDKITAKNAGTRKVAFALKKFGLRILTSGELEEDSIIPTLQFIRNEIVDALATADEYAIINGDTDATTQDVTDQAGDTIHAKSNLKAFDGYRRIASDIGGLTISSGGTLTASHARRCFASMGRFAADVTKLAWVTGTRGMFTHFMALGDLQTLDKVGDKAVVLRGQVGQYLGAPIVLSEWMREDLGLSGLSGGSAGVTQSTNIILVRKDGFWSGEGRSVKIETEKDIDTDQIKVVGTRRKDFKNMYNTAATNTPLCQIKGLTA